LEADALLGSTVPDADWMTRIERAPQLALAQPAAAAVELVRTLAGIYRSVRPVAATVTGPVTLASVLAGELLADGAGQDERTELAEMAADLLAALVGAYVDAGAAVLIVFEPRAGFLSCDADRLSAPRPLERAAGHLRAELFVARPGTGIPPEVWALPPEAFAEQFDRHARGGPELILSAGAVPPEIPLENLRRARARVATTV
jgi:hypothetical protein